jgi:hypothetical protein
MSKTRAKKNAGSQWKDAERDRTVYLTIRDVDQCAIAAGGDGKRCAASASRTADRRDILLPRRLIDFKCLRGGE